MFVRIDVFERGVAFRYETQMRVQIPWKADLQAVMLRPLQIFHMAFLLKREAE